MDKHFLQPFMVSLNSQVFIEPLKVNRVYWSKVAITNLNKQTNKQGAIKIYVVMIFQRMGATL